MHAAVVDSDVAAAEAAVVLARCKTAAAEKVLEVAAARAAAAAAALGAKLGEGFRIEMSTLEAYELCVHYHRQLSSIYSRYTVSLADARRAKEIGGHYLALKTFLGDAIGANDLQICVVLPYYLETCEFM
jgi:hypothetical protein